MAYVDYEKAMKKIQYIVKTYGLSNVISDKIENALNKSTADVVEVKHGKWLPDYETFVDEWERESEPIQTGWVCSLCGRQEFNREPYCHCGAKMDGKDNNVPTK